MFENYLLHHVGIVAHGFDEAELLMETLELQEDYRGFVELWSCWCIFTKPGAGAAIELVVPEGGPLAKFNKGLSGVHHYAYQVDSIVETMRWAEGKGLRMISDKPVKGAGDFWCNFLSPASARGVQIEFVEPF